MATSSSSEPQSGSDPGPDPTTPQSAPPRTSEPRLTTEEQWRLRWHGQIKPYLGGLKLLPAFWTTASVLSLVVNVILIALLIGLARDLFTLKGLVSDQLIGGLHDNFVKMDEAHIITTILVSDTIQVVDTMPVVFDVPLKKNTTVTLVKDTPVENATIFLNNSPVPLDLILRKGTELNIRLDLVVPVSQTIPVVLDVPVRLTVPVDIPLQQTQLHEAFAGLHTVVEPYHGMLLNLPQSTNDTPFCGPLTGWLCSWFFRKD